MFNSITSTNEAFIQKHFIHNFVLLTMLLVSLLCEITFVEVICGDYLYFSATSPSQTKATYLGWELKLTIAVCVRWLSLYIGPMLS